MSPLHSQTSVPQHGPQRWWVRKGSHDTRQNQFKTQHCGPGPGTIVPRARWYGSAEGPPRGVENRNLLSHPDDLRMEVYVIRMT